MDISGNIESARKGFESSFSEAGFYEKQTADNDHLNMLLNMVGAEAGSTVLDLGTGAGYLAFPLAEKYTEASIIGLDIVEETLKRSSGKAAEEGRRNLIFRSYDGRAFPFADGSADTVVTRYALHHFPDIAYTFGEIYRVLKPGGRVLIADPTPNENDSCGFADQFMQMKPDGHMRFYRLREYQSLLGQAGFRFISNTMTEIRFPRREPERYTRLLAKTPQEIAGGYRVQVIGDEIWITEKVLNMVFMKQPD